MVNIVAVTKEEDEFEKIDDQEVDKEEEVYVGWDCGEYVSCVVHKLLLTLVNTKNAQRHGLFKTQCTINKMVCDVIVNSESYENIVSKASIKMLGLTIVKHPHPYKVGWIKCATELTVNEVYQVTISIGKYYQDKVTCDAFEMSVCHLLLGRPWQFDREVIYKDKENIYVLTW